MLLFLFFLHLIKYSEKDVNISHYYIFYSFPFYFFWFLLYVSQFLYVKCLMVYDVYLLSALYLFSLKIFIFVSFNNKLILRKESDLQCSRYGLDPWFGKIPHAGERLSPRAPTTEARARPILCNKRSHNNEKHAPRNQRKPMCHNEDPAQPKIKNKYIYFFK